MLSSKLEIVEMVEPRSEDENSELEEMLVSGLETKYPVWNKIV